MMKKERIVHYTTEQLKAMPSDTNWELVNSLTDEDITRLIAEDPDAAPILDDEFFKTAQIVCSSTTRKKRITMMVEEEVLEFFQNRGKAGYQKRMHDVLKAYVKHDAVNK